MLCCFSFVSKLHKSGSIYLPHIYQNIVIPNFSHGFGVLIVTWTYTMGWLAEDSQGPPDHGVSPCFSVGGHFAHSAIFCEYCGWVSLHRLWATWCLPHFSQLPAHWIRLGHRYLLCYAQGSSGDWLAVSESKLEYNEGPPLQSCSHSLASLFHTW